MQESEKYTEVKSIVFGSLKTELMEFYGSLEPMQPLKKFVFFGLFLETETVETQTKWKSYFNVIFHGILR